MVFNFAFFATQKDVVSTILLGNGSHNGYRRASSATNLVPSVRCQRRRVEFVLSLDTPFSVRKHHRSLPEGFTAEQWARNLLERPLYIINIKRSPVPSSTKSGA